ncbi:lysosome membrane protein 2-like isoform X1 [Amphibalanus amphitrite]|uniref:lysosome membrane protein 2-like isoform X1 n=1 Tax=Amphibalanus amphitrite TaxID=1232801 RepID=UPI001C90A1B8|nr:lysosome membrane protein 2-like isoform X1 [Amphibalanus amphitrite]
MYQVVWPTCCLRPTQARAMARDGRKGWEAVPTRDLGSYSESPSARRSGFAACCCSCLPGCALVSGLLFLVFGVLVVIYMQAHVDAYINKLLAFSEDSPTYHAWKEPPVAIKTKLYFFNLTNKEEFLAGTAKPRLQEVGPYVLGEKWDRKNVTFHPNGTLSSQLAKTLYLIEEESVGPETDLITTLNVPMISAAAKVRYEKDTMRQTTSGLLEVLEEYPIIVRSVHELVFGYPDPLVKLAKNVQPPGQSLPYESFGYFVGKNASAGPPMLINTGQSDFRKIGVIERYDGSRLLPFWNTRQCNMINGSDGTVYPPGANESTIVYLFARDICRSMALHFEKEVLHSGVRALRFTPPENVFDSVDTNPENMCYCVGGPPCAPKGLFNISVCQYGSPTFISFPHFYLADPSIVNKVDGLMPSKDKHQFFVDIVPRVGVSMKAKIRVQINTQIGPVPDIEYTENLPDMFYPVLWMEAGVDELPDETVAMVKQATDTPEVARTTMTAVTFVLGAVLVLIGATVCLTRMRQSRRATLNSAPNGKPVEMADVNPTNGSAGNGAAKLAEAEAPPSV